VPEVLDSSPRNSNSSNTRTLAVQLGELCVVEDLDERDSKVAPGDPSMETRADPLAGDTRIAVEEVATKSVLSRSTSLLIACGIVASRIGEIVIDGGVRLARSISG